MPMLRLIGPRAESNPSITLQKQTLYLMTSDRCKALQCLKAILNQSLLIFVFIIMINSLLLLLFFFLGALQLYHAF